MNGLRILRREFLKTAGLVIFVSITPMGVKVINASSDKEALRTFKPAVWYEVRSDESVFIYFGNSDMGQG